MIKVIRVDNGREITGEYRDTIIEASKLGKTSIQLGATKVIIKSDCKNKKIIKIMVR